MKGDHFSLDPSILATPNAGTATTSLFVVVAAHSREGDTTFTTQTTVAAVGVRTAGTVYLDHAFSDYTTVNTVVVAESDTTFALRAVVGPDETDHYTVDGANMVSRSKKTAP